MGSYNAASIKGYLGAMLIISGYLKHHIKFWIICDIRFLKDKGEVYLEINWLDIYPEDVEEFPPDM